MRSGVFWTVMALLALGTFLRVWPYTDGAAFWGDEAALAMNIVPRTLGQLSSPMVLDQAAPYGFLVVEKLVVLPLGSGERAMRLLPLVGSVVTLALVYVLARRSFGQSAGLIALLLAAICPHLIYYSTQLKPYSTDVTVNLALLLCSWMAARGKNRTAWLCALAPIGAAALWLSYPAAFVLAGAGVALMAQAIGCRNLRHTAIVGAAVVLWLIAFMMHLHMFIVSASQYQNPASFDLGFLPFPPHSISDLRWYGGKFFFAFTMPGGLGLRYLAGAVFILGCWAIYRSDRLMLVLLLGPIAAMLIASAMRRYPVLGRVILFLAPNLLIIISAGLVWLARLRWPAMKWVAACAAVAMLVTPAVDAAQLLRHPRNQPDIRDITATLKQQYQPGDVIFIENSAIWIYTYYSYVAEFHAPVTLGKWMLFEESDRDEVISSLAGHSRVWVVVPTFRYPNGLSLGEFLTSHLDAVARRLQVTRGVDVELYLYDTRDSDSAQQRQGRG